MHAVGLLRGQAAARVAATRVPARVGRILLPLGVVRRGHGLLLRLRLLRVVPLRQ